MGRIGSGADPVTKTTNAVLVLPRDRPDRYEKTENFSNRFKTCSIHLLPV